MSDLLEKAKVAAPVSLRGSDKNRYDGLLPVFQQLVENGFTQAGAARWIAAEAGLPEDLVPSLRSSLLNRLKRLENRQQPES